MSPAVASGYSKVGSFARRAKTFARSTDSETTSTSLPELVDLYLTSREAGGVRQRTLDHYRRSLTSILLPWCAAEGIGTGADLTSAVLDRLQASLYKRVGQRGKPLAPNTVRAYMDPVRFMIEWAAERGYEVGGTIAKVRVPRRRKHVLTLAQMQALEEAAGSTRDALIVALFTQTGMRVGELLRLKVSDIYSKDRQSYIRIDGKGGRTRHVAITAELRRRLERYGRQGQPDRVGDALFVSLRKVNGLYYPATENTIQKTVRDLGRDIGLDRPVWPHLLRHSFITDCLSRGMNESQVKELAGNFNSLEIYTHISQEDAGAALMRHLAARAER